MSWKNDCEKAWDRIDELEAEVDALRLLHASECAHNAELRVQLGELTRAIHRRLDEAPPLPASDTPETAAAKAKHARSLYARAIEILGLGDKP